MHHWIGYANKCYDFLNEATTKNILPFEAAFEVVLCCQAARWAFVFFRRKLSGEEEDSWVLRNFRSAMSSGFASAVAAAAFTGVAFLTWRERVNGKVLENKEYEVRF
jgi:hypothetical protein